MTLTLVSMIDAEIGRLQEARDLLVKPARKNNISAEGRKRIGDAVRARWAKRRAAKKKSAA